MSVNYKQYELFADILAFPKNDLKNQSNEVYEYIKQFYPQFAEEFEHFKDYAQNTSTMVQGELYTRTFEVQAITTLEVGYLLFGEDYKRGALLANLNRELREYNIETDGELSDHLPYVLRLLAKIQEDDYRNELVKEIIAPAMKLIIDEFGAKKMEYKNKFYKKQYKTIIESSEQYKMIYYNALRTIYNIIKTDFDIKKDIISLNSNDFLKSLNDELAAENEKV